LTGRQRWTLTSEDIPPLPRQIKGLLVTQSAPLNEGGLPVLEVHRLTKRFGSLVVADEIDLRVEANTLHSLIGPNGAGKTTFFNMLTGLLPSQEGRLTFVGRDITNLPAHKRIDGGLARSFQIVSVFSHLTVFETVRVAAQARSPYRASPWRNAYQLPGVCERAWSLLATVGLVDRGHEPCANLAHGEQRLLEIAVALATDPELLLLDEPLAGLGDADRERIGVLIRDLSRHHTCLLIEHDIYRVLSLSDRITVLHQGCVIAEGDPAKIAKDPAVLEAIRASARAQPPGELQRISGSLLALKDIDAGYDASSVLMASILVRVVKLWRCSAATVPQDHDPADHDGSAEANGGTIAFAGSQHRCRRPCQSFGDRNCTEGRRIFPNLTVEENLMLGQRDGWHSTKSIQICCACVKCSRKPQWRRTPDARDQARPVCASKLILLDEPFGLAPSVVAEVLAAISRLRQDKYSSN
jgi:ABC-type branched-subunit amino acid transport system ATPase component